MLQQLSLLQRTLIAINRALGGSQSKSGHFGREKKLLPLLEFDHQKSYLLLKKTN
jgi:hypothetical protein